LKRKKRSGRARPFGTTNGDYAASLGFGVDIVCDAPVLQASKAELHKLVRDGATRYRIGEELVELANVADDEDAKKTGLNMMRAGVYMQLQGMVAFCMQTMDYRFLDELGVVWQHTHHVWDLIRGVQAPYLMMANRKGGPHSTREIQRKADCVVALDCLQRRCGLSAQEAEAWLKKRLKTLPKGKGTIQGWGKPDRRKSMRGALEHSEGRLDSLLRLADLAGQTDIRGMIEEFLRLTARSPRSNKPLPQRIDECAKHSRGFAYMDARAKGPHPANIVRLHDRHLKLQ